jgi:hypothetical protein
MSLDENFMWKTTLESGVRLQIRPVTYEGKIEGLSLESYREGDNVGRGVTMSIEAAEAFMEGMVEVVGMVNLGREVASRLEG